MILSNVDRLMYQTIDSWQREDDEILYNRKKSFMYVISQMEYILSQEFRSRTEWVQIGDTFVKAFDNSPTSSIPPTYPDDSRLKMEISFHKNMFRITEANREIVSLKFDENGVPNFGFGKEYTYSKTHILIRHKFKWCCLYGFDLAKQEATNDRIF